MSRVASVICTPVQLDKRTSIQGARRARILAKNDGRCCYPGCQEWAVEVDHTIALALGGRDAESNMRGMCSAHHLQKTRLDVRMIAKAKRIVKKADPATRKPSRMRSRGFQRNPTLRRTFGGKVVPR